MSQEIQAELKAIISDVKELIEESKQQMAVSVNTTMSFLYWQIGKRVNKETLQDKRAEYGKQIVSTLSRQLEMEYGSSFSEKNLRRMMQFATVFPEKEIVVSLIRQLSWTHIIALLPMDDPLKREFYIEMCKLEKWSVRTFRERIQSMLYERTALSKKSGKTIQNNLASLKNEQKLNPDLVFRDPLFSRLFGLKGRLFRKRFGSFYHCRVATLYHGTG